MRIKINKPDNLIIKPGTLIISNHQSKSDPFFIAYHMGWKNALTNFPLHFPTTHEFMTIPILGWYLWSLNCFNVGITTFDKAKILLKIRDLLKQNKTVVLFPEGQRIKVGNEVEEFHPGFDILLRDKAPILMVRIYNFNNWSIFNPKKKQVTMDFKELSNELTLDEKKSIISSFYR
jgi:1-acyl-sn-glycerol-3-phosphate acyltransferase